MTTPLSPLNPTVSTHTRAVLRYPLTLSTHIGVKTYNRTFKRLEAALFLADVLVLLRGRASSDYALEIAQVHSAMDQELSRLDARLMAEQQWVTKALKAAPTEAQVQYTDPVTLNLTLRTPRARPYVALLTRLEQTLCGFDQAWYHGVIPTAEQLKRGTLLFRHFYRACGVIERLAWGLGRRVRDAQEGATTVHVGPDYHAMLLKRTGHGPAHAQASDAAGPDEAADAMTAEENASLEATEALVASLTPVAGGAEQAESPLDDPTNTPPFTPTPAPGVTLLETIDPGLRSLEEAPSRVRELFRTHGASA